MAKKPDNPKPSDRAQGGPAIPMRKQIAMGMKPNTGANSSGGVREKP